MDLNDVVNYKEKIIPAGKYEVEVLKAKLGVWKTGRQKIDLTVKIVDTIPSGEEINYDLWEDPIGKVVFPTVNIPYDKSDEKYKASSEGFITKLLRDYIANFSVEIPEDGTDVKALTENFVDMVGGVIVKHEPSDRDDPDSDPRAVADNSCSLA